MRDELRLPALIREYQMVTNKCGIIDLTWKGKIEVEVFTAYFLFARIPKHKLLSTLCIILG